MKFHFSPEDRAELALRRHRLAMEAAAAKHGKEELKNRTQNVVRAGTRLGDMQKLTAADGGEHMPEEAAMPYVRVLASAMAWAFKTREALEFDLPEPADFVEWMLRDLRNRLPSVPEAIVRKAAVNPPTMTGRQIGILLNIDRAKKERLNLTTVIATDMTDEEHAAERASRQRDYDRVYSMKRRRGRGAKSLEERRKEWEADQGRRMACGVSTATWTRWKRAGDPRCLPHDQIASVLKKERKIRPTQLDHLPQGAGPPEKRKGSPHGPPLEFDAVPVPAVSAGWSTSEVATSNVGETSEKVTLQPTTDVDGVGAGARVAAPLPPPPPDKTINHGLHLAYPGEGGPAPAGPCADALADDDEYQRFAAAFEEADTSHLSDRQRAAFQRFLALPFGVDATAHVLVLAEHFPDWPTAVAARSIHRCVHPEDFEDEEEPAWQDAAE